MNQKHTKTDQVISKDRISHTALTIKIMRDQLVSAVSSTSEVAPMVEDIKKYVNKISDNNKTEEVINNKKQLFYYLIAGVTFLILLIFSISLI